MKDKTDEIKQALEVKNGHEVSLDNVRYLISGWLMSGKEIEELLSVLTDKKEEYSNYTGFATPSLLLEGSTTKERGWIIDTESDINISDAQGLICGWWSKGWQDDLIHLYLMKPIAAICDERQGWINKQMFLKEPIIADYSMNNAITKKEPMRKQEPKKTLVLDPETKQFRMM